MRRSPREGALRGSTVVFLSEWHSTAVGTASRPGVIGISAGRIFSTSRLLAGLLAVFAYSTRPELSLELGTAYLVALGLVGVSTFRSRKARDHVQAEVFWGLASLINKEIFQGDHRTRFTLFKPASFRPEYITPWYRYFKGGQGPIEEAKGSRARYRREDGLTGQAWAEAGDSLLCLVFPEFKNRQQFEAHYINELHISKEIVRELSPYMEKVQTMFCYAFVGDRERTLGVLSLDFQAPLTLDPNDPDGNPLFPSPQGEKDVVLDRTNFRLLISSVQNVLESFARAERRQR